MSIEEKAEAFDTLLKKWNANDLESLEKAIDLYIWEQVDLEVDNRIEDGMECCY